MDSNGNVVLIGPNAWPVIWSAIIILVLWWMLDRWAKKLPLLSLPSWFALPRRRVTTDGAGYHSVAPHVSPPTPQLVKVADPPVPIAPVISLLNWTAKERGFTVISGAPGDGKTQSSIAMMVNDIGRGLQVVWLNPHLTLYHPEDQTTNLRPLAPHFEYIREYTQISAALKEAYRIVQERMPL